MSITDIGSGTQFQVVGSDGGGGVKVQRLAVFGSRTLDDERVMKLILDAIDDMEPSALVTAAEPEGVCECARRLAAAIPMPLHLHFLDRQKKAAGAWHHRSANVLKSCEHVVLIHDGVSKGTATELRQAMKMKVPHTYHKLKV